MRKYILLICGCLSMGLLAAQNICDVPPAKSLFHANDIRAQVSQRGGGFVTPDQDAGFQVPYEGADSPSALFAKGLWISGVTNNGRIQSNFTTYERNGNCGYLPGPAVLGRTGEEDFFTNWNKIFNVRANDINLHLLDAEDGQIDNPLPSIFGWPAFGNEWFEDVHGFPLELSASKGAYFIEVEGSKNGIYEPELGEYPHVEGLDADVVPEQIAWMVYNTTEKLTTHGDIMNLEIHEVTYAFDCEEELNQTLFQQFNIHHVGQDRLTDFRVGIWLDPDLGCYTDDYIGTSIPQNTMYIYNEDNLDGTTGVRCQGGAATYGENPPALSATFLNRNLDAGMYYLNGAIDGPAPQLDPYSVIHFHNILGGRWLDGTAMTRGGSGYEPGSTDTVFHAYSDLPTQVNGWSMYQEQSTSADRRLVLSTWEDTFAPGQQLRLDVAYHYAREAGKDHLENVEEVLDGVDQITTWYNSSFPCQQREVCDCDCVWPLDANNNGRVEYTDLAHVIGGLGMTGDQRNPALPWKPESNTDWNEDLFDVNAKYADANGDGIIDEADWLLFDQYVHLENQCWKDPGHQCPEGDEVYFQMQVPDSADWDKGINVGYVKLKEKNNVLGLSFELQYDPDLTQVMNIGQYLQWERDIPDYFKWVRSLDESVGSEQIFIMNGIQENVPLNETADNNLVLLALLHRELPQTYHSPYAEFKICDFIIYYEDGTKELVPAQTLRYRLPGVVVTDVEEEIKEDVYVYPNPTEDEVRIVGLGEGEMDIQLMDINGRSVRSWKATTSRQFNISDLQKGMYFLRITDGKNDQMVPLVKH